MNRIPKDKTHKRKITVTTQMKKEEKQET